MPVYPEFQSEGDAGQAYNAGQNSGMSMMERAQQLEQRGAQEARQQAIYQAGLPVLQAKNEADLATAHATINHAVQTQNLMTKAAQVSDTANAEFQDAQQLSDWTAKADALSALQAKYAWMGQLPGYKPFVSAINQARNDAHGAALLDMKYNTELEIAKQNNISREKRASEGNDTKETIALSGNAAKSNIEEEKLKQAKELATMRVSSRELIASGTAPAKVADAYTSLADSEEKNALALKLTGNEAGYQARMDKAQQLRTEAEGVLKGSTTSQQKNITPEEYAKVPSGGKYWWNGQEITKK